MADASPQPNNPGPDNKKIGSLVERLRSFESDMARLKGVQLKPVVPEKKIEEEKPKVVQPIIAGKPEPHLEANGNALSSLRATNTIVSDVIKEDPKKAVEALHKEAPVQTFHTIQTDIADAAKNKQASPEKAVAQQALHQNRKIIIEDPKRSAYLLGVSSILVIGGLIALGGYYIIKHQPKAPIAIATDAATIIPIQDTKDIQMSSTQSIISQIKDAQSQPLGRAHDIIKLNFKDSTDGQAIDSQRFASQLSSTIPTWLVRSFAPTPFLAGLYNDGDLQPFVIFKVTSYDNGYAGMLKWEETIGSEWQPLLAARVVTSTSTNASNVGAQNPIIPSSFKDILIKNKDVRSLEDANGHKLLLYSFVDPSTLVITTSQQALEEVFARLTTSQFLR